VVVDSGWSDRQGYAGKVSGSGSDITAATLPVTGEPVGWPEVVSPSGYPTPLVLSPGWSLMGIRPGQTNICATKQYYRFV